MFSTCNFLLTLQGLVLSTARFQAYLNQSHGPHYGIVYRYFTVGYQTYRFDKKRLVALSTFSLLERDEYIYDKQEVVYLMSSC